MSRSTPPAAPVMVPMMTATQSGKPAARVFSMPTTVKSPRPMASKTKKVLLSRMR